MAELKNAICPICGKAFKICRTCSEHELVSWKSLTDTEDCFKIFTVLHKYFVRNACTKEEAKKELEKIQMLDIKEYAEPIQKQIAEIKGIQVNKDEKTSVTKEPVKVEVANEKKSFKK